jgi:hypothetical protein
MNQLYRLMDICTKRIESGTENENSYFVYLYCEYVKTVLVPSINAEVFEPYYNTIVEFLGGFFTGLTNSSDIEFLERIENEIFEKAVVAENVLSFTYWDRHRKLDIIRDIL